jgi:WD40 repeat protein
VAFSPDGNTLAAGGLAKPNFGEPNGGVFLWDLKTFKQSNLKPEHEGNEVFTIAFSPKSNLLASGGSSGILFLWDWSKAEFLDALKTEIKHAGCVRFSSDGSHLLVGGWNGRVQVFSRP